MGDRYLVIEENKGGDRRILYVGEGSFDDWRQRMGEKPELDRSYNLRQITIDRTRDGEEFLMLRMTNLNPVGCGPAIFEDPVSEIHTAWAGMPLNPQIREMLIKALGTTQPN